MNNEKYKQEYCENCIHKEDCEKESKKNIIKCRGTYKWKVE